MHLNQTKANKKVTVFRNVKVFAADPWYKAQPGFVKDLSIKIKEAVELVRDNKNFSFSKGR